LQEESDIRLSSKQRLFVPSNYPTELSRMSVAMMHANISLLPAASSSTFANEEASCQGESPLLVES